MQSLVLILSLVLRSVIADGEPLSIGRRSFDAATDVIFQLYTTQNPSTYTALIPNDDSSLGSFSETRPTRFVIHGWESSAAKMASIKDAYLSVGDFNVILVDWSETAANLYTVAKGHVDDVGEYVAKLLNYLATKGLSMSNVHIGGHSLGAHIAGVAGNRVTAGKLAKITGMDPALPLFVLDSLANRLDSSDATFVEVIHTCGGLLGFPDPLGHIDFYPNNGIMIQPGCGLDLGGACSHSRSHVYFEESITSSSGFYGRQCSSWDNFKDGDCSSNPTALMGEYTDTSASGIYYLETHSSSPYAEGL